MDIIISYGKHDHAGGERCLLEWCDLLDRQRRGIEVRPSDVLSDKPDCVCPVIRDFGIAWNDALPNDAERTRLLGKYVDPANPLLLGTNRGPDVAKKRAWMGMAWLVNVFAAEWLALAGLTEHSAKIRALDVREENLEEVASVLSAARATARAAAESAAESAAWSAWSAAESARKEATQKIYQWFNDHLSELEEIV